MFNPKIAFLTVITCSSISAVNLTQLEQMPKSVEKDFYIWRFLNKKDIKKSEALKTRSMIYHLNGKLIKSFHKKTGIKLHKKKYSYGTKSDKKKYAKIISNLQKEPSFYKAWMALRDKDKLEVFNLSGKSGRKALNHKFPIDTFRNMSKYRGINELIYRAYRENVSKVKEIINTTAPVSGNKINYNNLMKIGYYDLLHNRANIASKYFNAARYKARDRFSADRAIFWNYMASKDRQLLEKLYSSYDFNMYKLLACDFLQRPYPAPAKLPKPEKENIDYDYTNPIEWAKLKKKIFSKRTNLFSLAKSFKSKNTLGYYSYILNKAQRDTKQYFPLIYGKYMHGMNSDKKAIILSIMRQESRFIPASVSSSFALGLMQFMPFLVDDMAKKRKIDIPYEDVFKPSVSISLASDHIDYLKKYLYSPLYVAYAYNAGIGYTRRVLKKGIHFRKKRLFEPYISMELLKNEQARVYGQKVLANYVIYKKLLGDPIKITDVLKNMSFR